MYQSRIRQNKGGKRGGKNKVLLEPEEGQEYAVVKDMLGNGRLRAMCQDGSLKIGRIRGSMRKYAGKVIIDRGDLILVSTRDFGNDDKVDVFHKYSHEDVSTLMRHKMLPEIIYKAITLQDEQTFGKTGTGDEYIVFMSDDDDVGEEQTQISEKENQEESDLDIDAI